MMTFKSFCNVLIYCKYLKGLSCKQINIILPAVLGSYSLNIPVAASGSIDSELHSRAPSNPERKYKMDKIYPTLTNTGH